MVEAQPGTLTRDQIKEQLLQTVKKHLDAASSYSQIEEDKDMELVIKSGEENGIGLTVSRMFAKGLTVEDFDEWYSMDNLLTN